MGLLPEADLPVAGALQDQVVRARGEDRIGDEHDQHDEVDTDQGGQRGAAAGDEQPDYAGTDQRQDGRSAGEHHQRGTGTLFSTVSITASAVTPSSSASGRILMRCRRAGPASALASSGVT